METTYPNGDRKPRLAGDKMPILKNKFLLPVLRIQPSLLAARKRSEEKQWRHGSHIGVPKQWNGGHIGVPNKSGGSWTLFLCKKIYFAPINLHRCSPREWMRSIQPTLRESNCVLPFDITQIFLQYVISPRQMSQLFFFLCSSQLECDDVNMFSRQYAVICLYFSFKLIFHRWSLVKQFFYPFIRCPWILSR